MRKPFISIDIDEKAINGIIEDLIVTKIKSVEEYKVFFTMKDLEHITGCSEGYIRDRFFDDPRFSKIKRKAGRKWLFPAQETKEFLLAWLREQPNN